MYGVTQAHLAYLQRAGTEPTFNGPARPVPTPLRGSLRVHAIGLEDKHTEETDARTDEGRAPRGRSGLLAGLHGLWVPLTYAVTGTPSEVSVTYGTWSDRPDNAEPRIAQRLNVIRSALAAQYTTVTARSTGSATDMQQLGFGGLALGVPSPPAPIPGDRVGPIDRVIRAMIGCHWAVRIIAYPESDQVVAAAQQALLNSARLAQTRAGAESGPSPLTEQYVELCKDGLRALTDAAAVGGWRTAVYLLGDRQSYPRLAAVWRSVFSGPASKPEPVRVYTNRAAVDWALDWALPDVPVPDGPDGYRRPYEAQTLLSSQQLGAYTQLPRQETAGFTVRTEPIFDVEPPHREPGRPQLILGRVKRHDTTLHAEYTLPAADLTRHTFVTGVTGAGKTNTIFALLHNAASARIPFLVIEPAKAEYRTLLADRRLPVPPQVFTLGDETVSPLRLNPFEVEAGTSVQMHLDLLRSLFVASFGMWDPLPQVLERCLFDIYADRGWDIADDTNHRLGTQATAEERELAFPTLADLVIKAEEVINELGYEDKIRDNLRAALVTRIDALRIGGKGAMLDTQRSTPAKQIFERPTVLELERLGDDDDKAFVMGLVLIRLAEYRRAAGYADDVQHLLVIEEAHRLLANTTPKSGEFGGDPKAKAVTAFTNLLAEIRVYGLGVVIADQVPVKLAPDVIKNTNLKIVHRLVAEDDRKTVGATMAMRPNQIEALTTLPRGTAAMFSEGDDGPVLVEPPHIKDLTRAPSDDQIRTRMTGQVDLAACSAGCPSRSAGCRLAAELAERPEVRRCADRALNTVLAMPDRITELWADVTALLGAELSRRSDIDRIQAISCVNNRLCRTYAHRRGAALGWSYQDTNRIAQTLCDVVTDPASVDALIRLVEEVCTRPIDPFPRCRTICGVRSCLHRPAAQAVSRTTRMRTAVTEARKPSNPERPNTLLEVARDAAHQVIALPPNGTDITDPRWLAADRMALCFLQQVLLADTDTPVSNSVALIDQTCAAADIHDGTRALDQGEPDD